MADKIQHRRDTRARWEEFNPVLSEGELGLVTDNPNLYKMGDGINAWNDLPYRGFNGNIATLPGNGEDTVMSQKVTTEYLSDALWSNFYNGRVTIDTENTTITIGQDYVCCARLGTSIRANNETISYSIEGLSGQIQGIIYLKADRSLHFDTVGAAGTYNSKREDSDRIIAMIRTGSDSKTITYVNHICQSLLIDGVEYSTLGIAQNANTVNYIYDAFWSNFYNGRLSINTEDTSITIDDSYVCCAKFGDNNIKANGETIHYTVTGYNQGIIYLRKDGSLHFDTVGSAGYRHDKNRFRQ